MIDLTKGKKFDRVAMTWVDADEYDRRMADWEERVFMETPSQGELCAPMIITDTMHPVMSMTNGKMYDSKGELRKEYRRAGVVEVGNDGPKQREKPKADRKGRRAAIARALSKAGFGA